MESVSYIYDILFLAVFAVAAVCSWRKGFLAGLAELAGTLFSAAAALVGSRTLAPQFYDWFVREAVTEKVQQAVTETGTGLDGTLQGLDFLPEALRETLSGMVDTAGSGLTDQIGALLEPVILPLVQVLVFVVLCLVLRIVVAVLVKLLRLVNVVPLVGGLNRLLGLALGLCTGAVNCWLLAMFLWFLASFAGGRMEFLQLSVLNQSTAYRIFGAFNPFVPTVG